MFDWLKNLAQSDVNTGQGDRSKTAEGANWSADQFNSYNQGRNSNSAPVWPTFDWGNSGDGKA